MGEGASQDEQQPSPVTERLRELMLKRVPEAS